MILLNIVMAQRSFLIASVNSVIKMSLQSTLVTPIGLPGPIHTDSPEQPAYPYTNPLMSGMPRTTRETDIISVTAKFICREFTCGTLQLRLTDASHDT